MDCCWLLGSLLLLLRLVVGLKSLLIEIDRQMGPLCRLVHAAGKPSPRWLYVNSAG
jgi:hypothetical protein